MAPMCQGLLDATELWKEGKALLGAARAVFIFDHDWRRFWFVRRWLETVLIPHSHSMMGGRS